MSVLLAAAYLAIHLVAYLLVLRNLAPFTSERVIFLYHFVSAVVVSAAAILGAVAPLNGFDWASAAAIIALHGVYSVSFLEVWSLAEGSYSLQILTYLRRLSHERGGVPIDFDRTPLWNVGAAKQGNRVEGLAKVGLVRQRDDILELTSTGRVVAGVLTAIAWLANVQDEV